MRSRLRESKRQLPFNGKRSEPNACIDARPTHSGRQDRSELCVQKAVRTSGHCDITVQGGSLETSNPFNIVREEGRPMFLQEWNSC